MSYDTYEAARLISWSNKQAGIKPLTEVELSEWIDDGVGLLKWEDVWEEDGEVQRYIDFPTLISLRMICLLRSYGLSREEIKEFALISRQELSLEWPFASRFLWTYQTIPPDLPGSELMSRILQGVVIYLTGNPSWDLEFGEDGVAYAWLPVKDVVIDARVVSGSPCVKGTRTPTWVFPGMLKGGDSVEALADGYRLTEEQVLNALKWEQQLAAIPV